ncbi:MAG: polysaccharide biosynthesis/export family protein [Bacteroidales bacterium]|jgi:polysaccharide export outer membrane protein|nr:polysaccharide biosynthesis/export family protein [Bacteroidales bacterium]NLK54956.1 sugar transporter [Bacteroidales bacterium]HPY68375.1 polysaccharide biosynthesis/export family protein [Bacteroidales bacterium]
MKIRYHLTAVIILLLSACTSQEKLAYLSNLPETGGDSFTMEIPNYKLQPRDILYITAKAMTPDGSIKDFLTSSQLSQNMNYGQSEAGGYIYGFDINSEGNIILPVIGTVKVSDLTLEETRKLLQAKAEQVFTGATVECKLLSFKFTVIGEVNGPGSYVNYNNYLTVLEAIGRAGGVSDYGRRDKVLVVRPTDQGTRTYNLNLQDKNLLSSEAYFLLPNDVVIVEPVKQKIFNQNLPTISFIISTFTGVLTTTLLLINYFGKR